MASRRKKINSGIVRCFEVSDPTLHQKGHTIYKVTQRIINVDCPEEDVQEIIVWRRFNDFKKLYKAMVKLHQALHRNEEFPPFVEAKLFGRFGEEVIKRRMLVGQDLLNFIGQRHYLVASRPFQQFFQDGEMHKYEGIPALIQAPVLNLPSEKESGSVDLSCLVEDRITGSISRESCEHDHLNTLQDPKEGFPRVPSYNELLGGVWRYRQIAEEISLGDDDDDDETDFTDDSSALSTPVPDCDVSFFDPLKAGGEDKGGHNVSNEWLLSQIEQTESATPKKKDDELRKLEEEFAACGIGASPVLDEVTQIQSSGSSPLTGSVDFSDGAFAENLAEFDESHLENQSSESDDAHSGVSTSQSESSMPSKTRSGVVVERGKGDLVMSPVHKEKPNTFHRPLHSLTSTPSGSPQHGTSTESSPQPSPQRRGLVNIDVKDKADYIFLAANQISLAQQCEVNANYHMAFSYYKSAVGIMLTGVQKDDNKTRREVVRKKTAKYLLKAEKLYHMYLDSREAGTQDDRWDTGKPSPAKELDPTAAFLQGSLSEMRNFKVLGIIDKVLLIIDTMTDQTYVIKVLHKSCSGPLHHRSIVPVHLPYVVRLHKFYETENAIYLLIQHATGGKLWSYISGYLQQQNNSDPELDDILHDPHERKLRARTSSGDGKSTLKSNQVGSEQPVLQSHSEETTQKLVDIRENGVHFDNKSRVPCEEITEQAMSVDTSLNGNREGNVQTKHSSEIFSLDDSQDSLSLSSVRTSSQHPYSRSVSQDTQTSDSVKQTTQNVLEPQERFEELLQGTKCKPSLEQFSINSFDSDSGPGSRYESNTSDYIESIPELSELIDEKMESRIPDDVFSGQPTSSNVIQSSSDIDVITSTVMAISDANKEIDDDILNDNDTKINNTSASTPDDEPSIYDKYKEQDSSYISSEDESAAQNHRHTANDVSHAPAQKANAQTASLPVSSSHAKLTCSSQSRSTTTSPTKSTDLKPKQIFRVHSQDRSANGEMKPRKRHISSLFGSCDLDNDKMTVIRLPEQCVKQWAAEILVALTSLHSMGLICRDLKPNNLLLGDHGHVTLTYFSQWNSVDQEIDMVARDQLYVAPEVGGIRRELPSCDWWSLGALLYELFTGQALSSCLPCGITTHTQITVPDYLSTEAQDLLKQLLKFNPEERLGAGAGGIEEIKMHPFFIGVDWSSLQG